MKVLQYLPGVSPVMGGGMIKYALDLVHGEIQAGHEVSILVPGHFTHFHKDKTKVVKTVWKDIECYRIINPLPVSGGKGVQDISKLIERGDSRVYAALLEKINPDVIHVHSFMGLHITFLEAAHKIGIPVVYTTHDYYGICPKAILLNNMQQCTITDGRQCPYCVEGTMTIKKLKRQQSVIYEVLKNNPVINILEYSQKLVPLKIFIRSLRQKWKAEKDSSTNRIQDIHQEQEYKELQHYYKEMFGLVTKFHYNSKQSKEIFTQYLGNISGDIIPISDINISDNRIRRDFGKTLRIGFIGRGEYKGFHLLKEALENLYATGKRDIECHIYFNPKEKLPSYIISHAPYKEDDMKQVYDGIDVLVLPSVWKETYGLVVLEALSFGVPVIVSQNVGAKELLVGYDDIGMIINSTKENLYESIEKIYNNRELLSQMNLGICNCKFELDFEEHVRKVIGIYHMNR